MASPVLIPDESKVNLATAKDHWVKCGGISLNKRDLQRLTSGKELSDLHINAFQNLLKMQFSSIGGLQSTLLQQNKLPLSNKKENNLQAINISVSSTVKHWAVLEIKNKSIFLYDSAYTSVAGDGKQVIAHLINTNEDQLTVHMMNISKTVQDYRLWTLRSSHYVQLGTRQRSMQYSILKRRLASTFTDHH